MALNKRPLISRIDLEPIGGIAGDMFAAAMFSGFPYLYNEFINDLAALGVEGLSASLDDRLSKGLQAKYFSVKQQTALKPPRTLVAVKEFIRSKSLGEFVADNAIGIFTELARAESEVHGKTVDTVHFHEVSDWDSMVDIVAAAGIIARLNCPVWRVGVLPLGGGTVNTAHGDIPVPAPATLVLMKNVQWHDDGIGGERVTPTGAAILSYLKASPSGTTAPAASLIAVGSGCGSRELDGRANILRMVAFSSREHETELAQDTVIRIAFEVDDMTAEEIAWAADELRATNGVLDVACVAMQGKKNRAATGFRVITAAGQLHAVTNKTFLLTSTIGIRHDTVARFLLYRSEEGAENAGVKVVERPAGLISAKASSDDLASAGSLIERRKLALYNCESALRSYNNEKSEGDQ